jgi:DNA-dependent RNA polymerase auxiliary subunit epsilon
VRQVGYLQILWIALSMYLQGVPISRTLNFSFQTFFVETINSLDDKHVENRNKHTRKRIVRHVGYLQRLWIALSMYLQGVPVSQSRNLFFQTFFVETINSPDDKHVAARNM